MFHVQNPFWIIITMLLFDIYRVKKYINQVLVNSFERVNETRLDSICLLYVYSLLLAPVYSKILVNYHVL